MKKALEMEDIPFVEEGGIIYIEGDLQQQIYVDDGFYYFEATAHDGAYLLIKTPHIWGIIHNIYIDQEDYDEFNVATVEDKGRLLEVWRRQDGFHVSVWNTHSNQENEIVLPPNQLGFYGAIFCLLFPRFAITIIEMSSKSTYYRNKPAGIKAPTWVPALNPKEVLLEIASMNHVTIHREYRAKYGASSRAKRDIFRLDKE